MEKFTLILGEENTILSGKLYPQYEVELLYEKMVCTSKKDPKTSVAILYSDFKRAEFEIGSRNLWLQCELLGGKLKFYSPRKCWKLDAGKK